MGFGDLAMVEKYHTDFLMYICNVKKGIPARMLCGELGRYSISIIIKKRI